MRAPGRPDYADPWTEDEIGPLYADTPAGAPTWIEADVTDPPEPSGLLAPDGQPLPAPEPVPFGFQPRGAR